MTTSFRMRGILTFYKSIYCLQKMNVCNEKLPFPYNLKNYVKILSFIDMEVKTVDLCIFFRYNLSVGGGQNDFKT